MPPSGPASHAVRLVPVGVVVQDLLTVADAFIDWVQVAGAVLVDCKVRCPPSLSAAKA